MTPYYEQDGIVIYHGDCRDVLPSVAADVLVTDPPYGVDFAGKATKHTTIRSGGYTTEDCALVGPEVVAASLAMVKRGAVFPGTRNLYRYPEPADIGCVYCPSGAGIGRWGFTCFHPVLFYGGRASNTLRPTSIESFARADACGHPCPKPMPWMKWLVGMVSVTGETVLDPFMGTGTTLRAAKDLGCYAIGIEVEEKYCEIAADRLAQGTLDLFGEATA
jgi:site-specific DNA-methyltransferase (adenine-specific)